MPARRDHLELDGAVVEVVDALLADQTHQAATARLLAGGGDVPASEVARAHVHHGALLDQGIFNEQTDAIGPYSLFEHQLWKTTTSQHFSVVSVFDADNSIVHHNTINAYTDTAFLLIRLPEDMAMKKDDTLTITLLPAAGVTRTIIVTAPLPMQSVVSLLH